MDKRQIDRFFRIVDAEFRDRARAILTGAAAGNILGGTRPSMDVDFEIELMSLNEESWRKLESAIQKAVRETGIQANYTEDIDRWGMITLLDYRKNATLYKKYGKLALYVLDPAYWSIGKMTRFLNPDIQDMIQVFRKKKVSPSKLARVWGKALKESPRSTDLARFRRHVEGFFESYGRKIWGSGFDPAEVIRQFNRAAGIVE
jgi:hypothetical protein